jgi:hypothetical protein
MKTPVRGSDRSKRGAVRAVAFVFSALIVTAVLASAPASAQLLPPLPPLPLPTSSTGIDLLDDVTNLLTDVPDQLGSIVEDTTASLTLPGVTNPQPNPAPLPQNPGQLPITGSWSADMPPGLQAPVKTVPTNVSGTAYRRSLSYGAALSNGFRAAAGRAAALAGPLAAPIALALIAVGLIAVAARGPGRLVKVEEERQSGRERRSFRL